MKFKYWERNRTTISIEIKCHNNVVTETKIRIKTQKETER